jgi:hypothetical protein
MVSVCGIDVEVIAGFGVATTIDSVVGGIIVALGANVGDAQPATQIVRISIWITNFIASSKRE